MTNKKATISKARYEELLAAEDMLFRLEAAGVANWEGYSGCFDDEEEDVEDDD